MLFTAYAVWSRHTDPDSALTKAKGRIKAKLEQKEEKSDKTDIAAQSCGGPNDATSNTSSRNKNVGSMSSSFFPVQEKSVLAPSLPHLPVQAVQPPHTGIIEE